MLRIYFFFLFLAASLGSPLFLPSISLSAEKGVTSEHLLLSLPSEREALGIDLIEDLERCYRFMDGATGGKLPRRLVLVADWDRTENSCNLRQARIVLGMGGPAAAANPRRILLHSAACEMARLGLLELSGNAQREDNSFLFEGMIETLAHEFTHTSRSLEGAWVVSQLIDRMGNLGLANQRSWSVFSGGRRSFRNAAPGITFLTYLRELQGRDKPVKFFEALKKSSLTSSLDSIFKSPASELELEWLKQVRDYRAPEEMPPNPEAPELLQTRFSPEIIQPGTTLEIRLFIKDAARDLLPDGVFLEDDRTGRVLQPKAPLNGSDYLPVVIPVDAGCPPGEYGYRITAVDESGNFRRWKGSYRVVSP